MITCFVWAKQILGFGATSRTCHVACSQARESLLAFFRNFFVSLFILVSFAKSDKTLRFCVWVAVTSWMNTHCQLLLSVAVLKVRGEIRSFFYCCPKNVFIRLRSN